MTNLTEQMKQATLPNNIDYYYRINDSEPDISYGANIVNMYHNSTRNFEMEVLAEVPSYEELQNQAFILKSRESEIVKLKELLKECKEVLEMVQGETIDFAKSVDECIDKVNQVLGEE